MAGRIEKSFMIVDEGGGEWADYTKLSVSPQQTIRIIERFSLHRFHDHLGACKHPSSNVTMRMNDEIWKVQGGVATHYYLPKYGWRLIENPMPIEDYPVSHKI